MPIVNPVAENILGTMGAICWTIQLIPQLWKTFRTKSTDGLSEWTMLGWGIAGGFLGTYTVIQNINVPLIMQPQLFGSLCLVSWSQCQYYGHRRSFTVSLALLAIALTLVGGFEVGMVYVIRTPYRNGDPSAEKAMQFFGIFSVVIIAAALFPQYHEIWRYKEVIGISVIFMLIDALGGLVSALSLAFKPKFDVLAGINYILVVVMDMAVIVAALILNPLAKKRRALESEQSSPGMLSINDHASRVGIDLERAGSRGRDDR
ncbi:pq loop repeat protein [Moniliophthora roreri MCA 2997]|uniref:Pq loop repeat protein n=2 Tax=Moniliophthora roreri TaxID=221103 RepID=V2XY52_MONRO|nr:pq loop repeat protein [Moniliophthora roreri MCA 2997]